MYASFVSQGDDGLTGEMGPPGPTGHPVSNFMKLSANIRNKSITFLLQFYKYYFVMKKNYTGLQK